MSSEGHAVYARLVGGGFVRVTSADLAYDDAFKVWDRLDAERLAERLTGVLWLAVRGDVEPEPHFRDAPHVNDYRPSGSTPGVATAPDGSEHRLSTWWPLAGLVRNREGTWGVVTKGVSRRGVTSRTGQAARDQDAIGLVVVDVRRARRVVIRSDSRGAWLEDAVTGEHLGEYADRDAARETAATAGWHVTRRVR